MQYQINPPNPKRRSKHNIFPEKHHLELHKSTSNFKSEWTNTIHELEFHEVILKSPEIIEPKIINDDASNYEFEIKPVIPYNLEKERENERKERERKDREKDREKNKPIYEKKPKKEFISRKKDNTSSIKIYENKSAIIYSRFINLLFQNKINKSSNIPKNVFICWSTLELPVKMREVLQKNKQINLDFTFYLYDDEKCREFIQNFYEDDVLYAFDTLIPGAYKADLWRLCILFVYGGIYVDIKYLCVNGFTFANIIEKEHFTLDIPSNIWTNNMHGIYNGFIVSNARNPFLWKCIYKIVSNVKNKEYGKSCLYPTGPGLLGDLYFENCSNETEFIDKLSTDFECVFSSNLKNIVYRNTSILEIYPEYREDQRKEAKQYYSYLWNKRRIYDLNVPIPSFHNEEEIISIIPLKIYQTWYTKELSEMLQNTVNILKEQNPEFEFYLYDDNDCREFIKNNFDICVLNAFDQLIPGAYKADLFRYCILFIQGGIYLDIKYYGINGFKFISLTDKEYIVQDITSSGSGIYNALMICKAGNKMLQKAIDKIVEHVSIRFYGNSTLEPTGPLLLKKIIEDNKDIEIDNEIQFIHKEVFNSEDYNIYNYYIYNLKNKCSILTYNPKYRELQKELQKKRYYLLWEERNIYTFNGFAE
jgi:mannosyltransferase OCH1-like enzyme